MINRDGYGNMEWLDALSARTKPRDPTSDLGKQNEADLIGKSLETTAQVAFNMPVQKETKDEALERASRDIADRKVVQAKTEEINEIKNKMASNGIDPVALGIVSKDEWEKPSDSATAKEIAIKAALAYEKQLKHAWEKDAVKPAQHLDSHYDMTMREGRIMSATAANEDVRSMPSRTPSNANSIWDPFKLDRFAAAENSHDESVKASKEAQKSRDAEHKNQWKTEEPPPGTPGIEPMKGSQVVSAGGMDRDVFNQRIPKNQISMLDTFGEGKLPPDELKKRLGTMFARVEDNGPQIRAANETRREEIQGKKEEKQDRSWDTVDHLKPMSTSEITKRLMEKWMPPPAK
jgi:hypothetical protein